MFCCAAHESALLYIIYVKEVVIMYSTKSIHKFKTILRRLRWFCAVNEKLAAFLAKAKGVSEVSGILKEQELFRNLTSRPDGEINRVPFLDGSLGHSDVYSFYCLNALGSFAQQSVSWLIVYFD